MMRDASAGSKDLIDFSSNSIGSIRNKVEGIATKGLEGIQHKVSQVKETIQRTIHHHQEQQYHSNATKEEQPSNPIKGLLSMASEKLSNRSLTMIPSVDSRPMNLSDKAAVDTTTTTKVNETDNAHRPRKNLARAIINKAKDIPAKGIELETDDLDDESNLSSSIVRPAKRQNNLAQAIINKAAEMSAQGLELVPSNIKMQQSKEVPHTVSTKTGNQVKDDRQSIKTSPKHGKNDFPLFCFFTIDS